MIQLDIHIEADHPDELADAFKFLLDRGIVLEPVTDVEQKASGSAGNVVSLADHRTGERHA